MSEEQDLLRHREIGFRGPHPDKDQAARAMLFLVDAPGVKGVRRKDPDTIVVSYDLRHICFSAIEYALQYSGFHLDNSLLYKLQRAFYTYSEEILRANLGLEKIDCATDCAQKLFVSQYQKKQHGCRDNRPAHWREYL
jgi:hypothetical protein